MAFQLSYFKFWKMMLWNCCTQYASKFGKLSSDHRIGKGQFSFQSQRRTMPKNVQTTAQFAFISHDSKVMLKILQARRQQYMNRELPGVQVGFRKHRGTRVQIANIRWIIEKAREFPKHLLLIHWLHQSLWLCGSKQTVENSSRDGTTRPPDLPPEKPVCRSRSNS